MTTSSTWYGPVVTKGARQASRWVKNGSALMGVLKGKAHRKTRRTIRTRLRAIANGADVEGFDPTPPKYLCDSRDVA